MRAAIVQSAGELLVRDIPDPQIGPYDALCQLLYGATCTGTDLHIIGNCFPWPIQYPTLLGHESIGRVIRVGAKVRHLKTGDIVTRVGNAALPSENLNSNWGGFAEYGVARDHRAMKEDGRSENEWGAYRINEVLPLGIDPASATMMITWRETFSFISRLGMRAGKSILVVGSGGNGLAFLAHAKNLDASAVAMIGSADREAAARQVGATHYFHYSDGSMNDAIRAAFKSGFDIIIDAVGKATMLDDALIHCAGGGSVAHYGLDDHGKWSLNPARARGTFTYCQNGYDEPEAHAAIVKFVQEGKLVAGHWLNLQKPYALKDINAAYESVRTRREIKALIKLSAD
jgi:D-arabinose 1-dehydrogenase-like Zn-dependent alcohol dehydrogenase